MAKIKTYGVFIRRRDKTIPLTPEEEKAKKGYPIKSFLVRINSDIPFSHRIYEGNKAIM